MISGVFSILLGESFVFASLPLFCWFLFFVVGNAIYMPLVESRVSEHDYNECLALLWRRGTTIAAGAWERTPWVRGVFRYIRECCEFVKRKGARYIK